MFLLESFSYSQCKHTVIHFNARICVKEYRYHFHLVGIIPILFALYAQSVQEKPDLEDLLPRTMNRGC